MAGSTNSSRVPIELLPTRGFGMSQISMWERKLYDPSVSMVLGLLKGEVEPKRNCIKAINTLEGMFSRCILRDEDDWLTIYSSLGFPRISHLQESKVYLSELRGDMSRRNVEGVKSGLARLIKGNLFLSLWNYETKSNWISQTGVSGWVYILSQKNANPDILKIGMTRQHFRFRVQTFNRQTLVLYPFSVKMVYPVREARSAEAVVFERLRQFRIRTDREFFRMLPDQAIYDVEAILTDSKMLSRPQGVVKCASQVNGLGKGIALSSMHGEVFIPYTELAISYSPSLVGTAIEFDPTFLQNRLVGLRARAIDGQLTLEQIQEE